MKVNQKIPTSLGQWNPFAQWQGLQRSAWLAKERANQVLQDLWKDQQGQDLIEYALLAAFGALAVAVILPNALLTEINSVFSRVISGLVLAAANG
jgi:Flp pilus assembly pilin Flp